MKKKTLLNLIMLCVCLIFSSCKDDKKTNQILKKTSEYYQSQKSISYSVNFFINEDKDTILNKMICKMERISTDTIYGGKIWFNIEKYNAEVYYNLKNIYVVDHQKKKIEISDPHLGQSNVIDGNFVGSIIETYFLTPKKLYSIIQDTSLNISVIDLIENNTKYWETSILYPNSGFFTNHTKKILINKTNYNIEKICANYKIQGEDEFEILNLKDITFNQEVFTEIDGRIKELLKEYQVDIRKSKNKSYYNLLDNGTTVPDFSGTHFQTNKEVKLSSFKNKFIVLDFWYRSCYPCIKAIPHLNELYNEYKEEGLIVLGINSKDTKENDKKKLPSFIENNQVTYPIILTDYKTDSLYKVKVYPSLYVINHKKEVVFSQIGFSENLKDTLEKVINVELQQ